MSEMVEMIKCSLTLSVFKSMLTVLEAGTILGTDDSSNSSWPRKVIV